MTLQTVSSIGWRAVVVSFLLLTCLLLWPKATGAQDSTTFSGRATAFSATVLGINTVISDTGPLPPSGGAQQVSLLSTGVPGLFTADVLHATAVAQGSSSDSHASTADLNLTVAGNTISASFIMSEALARCVVANVADPPLVSGSSQIAALTINGQTIAVSGQPNQTIPLPGGTGAVIINEQKSSVLGQTGDITVNALHVIVDGIADVVVSSAHADITCPSVTPPTCTGNDFEVGEGEDHNPDTGDREEHSVACSDKQDSSGYWGHFEFTRHGQHPLKVHATRITKFEKVDAYTRHIEGECEVDGEPGHTFAADTSDYHSSGGRDRYRMETDRGDSGGNDLDHGDEENDEPCNP